MMSLVKSPGIDRAFDRMITSFFHDVNDFHRPTLWVQKRETLDFGADQVSMSDEEFNVTLDVSSFHANELKVTLEGDVLTVSGCHNEKSERGEMHREFSRRYRLPENIDAEQLKSNLSPAGILKIEAPKKNRILPTRNISIEFR